MAMTTNSSIRVNPDIARKPGTRPRGPAPMRGERGQVGLLPGLPSQCRLLLVDRVFIAYRHQCREIGAGLDRRDLALTTTRSQQAPWLTRLKLGGDLASSRDELVTLMWHFRNIEFLRPEAQPKAVVATDPLH